MAFDDVAVATAAVLPESAKALKRAPGEISNARLAVYALPSIPIAFLFLPVAMLMPAFYAREMHVSLSAIGIFLVVSRMADVFLDPMIGRWSDNTHSTFGRRKLWMVIGTPILMLGALVLFMPMTEVNGWYLLVASFIIYAGGSTVGLPYAAWGTELMNTYHGRSRMAGFREAAAVFGSLLAACIPAATGFFGHGIDRFTMGLMGWAIIILTPLMVWIAITFVPEPAVRTRVHVPLLPSLAALFKNKPFRLFCAAYVVYTIGASIPSATLVFFISDYLKAPNLVGPGMLLVALMTIVAVPLWLQVSRRIGKHKATAISLLVSMAIYGGVTPFLHAGDGWLYVGLLAIMGISCSGFVTLPMGLIGDIIDYDTLLHRQPRGGIYWGVWSFAQKVSPALAIGVTLPLLKYLGFQPGAHNTEAALEALKYVYCFGAVPFLLIAGIIFLYFPIDARRHEIIRRRLQQRQERAARAGAE